MAKRKTKKKTPDHPPRPAAPAGHEDACEPDATGWMMWKAHDDGAPPCAHVDCNEPYNAKQRAYAFECPGCGRPACGACMPRGRYCLCPTCDPEQVAPRVTPPS